MKKLLALILVLAMLLPTFEGLKLKAHADGVSMDTTDIKPFTMVNWDDPDAPIDNVCGLPQFAVNGKRLALYNDWTMAWMAGGNIQSEAQILKARMDNVPEGARFIYVATYSTFVVLAEDVIYHDAGVAKLKAWITEFLTYYKSIGGKLDGIALDTEYGLDSISNISSGQYNEIVASSTYNLPDKYDQVDPAGMLMRIQNNSKYPKLRKLLADEGFVFYEGTDKSELSYMLDNSAASYSYDRSVWNKVMRLLKRDYLHEAIFDPLLTFYEDAIVSDYDFTNNYSWQKTPGTHGYYTNVTGNSIEIGNTSNLYTYAQRPSKWFYAGYDGAYPPGYNKAVFKDTSFSAFLYDIRVFKDMQAATDEDGNLNAWVTFYDYNYGTNTAGYAANTVSGTPYHTEMLYHIGLMNPQPFLGYVYKNDIKNDEAQRRVIAAGKTVNTANLEAEKANLTSGIMSTMYQDRLRNLGSIMAELTRVVGASDREPIPYVGSWNSDFVISGMYAGGRNIWRISPNTTNGMTLEQFRVAGAEDPTFYINGQTVLFPNGKIVEETQIEPYGSCGYWVETPVGVEPVVINEADRHSKYPAYEETFAAALKASYWTKTGTTTVQDGALTLSGGATVKNTTVPKRVTAGDNYAKQQAWEVTFTVNNQNISATLLSGGDNDGIRLYSGNLQYRNGESYTTLMSISANTTYTVRREVDFVNKKSNYYVYDASGNELAKKIGATMNIAAPVSTIGFAVTSTSGVYELKLDNYKLYPMGVTTDFELYDAATGYKLTDATNTGATAYRLSWMNASGAAKKAAVVAEFYNGNALVTTKTVCEKILAPGADGVETQIVPLVTGSTSVKLSLRTEDHDGVACDHVTITCEDILLEATCKTTGTKEIITYCPACNTVFKTETVTIPATHTLVQVAEKAPTYAEPGHKAYSYCTVCDYTTKVEIPALDKTDRLNIMNGVGLLFENANTENAAKVYFGYAVPWSVVGCNGSGVASAAGNMTLFSDIMFDWMRFNNGSGLNVYADSQLRWQIEGIVASQFTYQELAAIEKRYLSVMEETSATDNAHTSDGVYKTPVANAALWPLSAVEAQQIHSALDDLAMVDGKTSSVYRGYWLRSPALTSSGSSTYVAYAYCGHTVSGQGSGNTGGIRPAFNLRLDSVLFTSAAVGGKAASGINALGAYTGNEWKLTVKDSDRTFEISEAVSKQGIVTVTYTGARVGTNEYISVLIADKLGMYTHYGRVAAVTATNGTVTIDLSGIDMTGKTLYVYNEQYNGGVNDDTKLTDYASDLIAVELTCEHTNTTTTEEVIQAATCGKTGTKTVTVTCACGEVISVTENVEIPATGEHTEETVPGTEADCENDGLTDGKKCSACGEILTEQETIPAGHSIKQAEGKEATCTENGWAAYEYCENCDYTTKVDKPAAGHTPGEWAETKKPTCTEAGTKERVCAVCGENKETEEISTTSHTFGDDAVCDICDFAPVSVTVVGNKVSVIANNTTIVKTHAFFIGEQAVEMNWSALKVAAYGFKSYQNAKFTLAENGKYVLCIEYMEGEEIKSVFFEIVIGYTPADTPQALVAENQVTVEANGNTIVKTHAFFIGEQTVEMNWKALKAAAYSFKSYQMTEFTLTEKGKYVLCIEYMAGEEIKSVFCEIAVTAAPQASVDDSKVSVIANGNTIVKTHAFFIGEQTVEMNWKALKAAAYGFKSYQMTEFTLAEKGKYVLCIEYMAGEEIKSVFCKVTVGHIPAAAPRASVDGNEITITDVDNNFNKVHVFYVGDQTVDMNWKALKAAAYSFKSYSKTEFALAETGKYVLCIEYMEGDQIMAAYQEVTVG